MSYVLCITGMHRSGTSLTASWFERCQLQIADGRLLGPGVGNPSGHFEDLDISDLQDAAIGRAHGSWRATDDRPLTFNAEELDALGTLIARRDSAFERWGWKDPRTVLFLREWKRLIPRLRVLIVWRPCAEVAESLRERARDAAHPYYSVTPDDAVRIWCAYNSAACAFARDYPADVLVVPIDTLLRHDEALLAEINRRWAIGLEYAPIRLIRDDTRLSRRAAFINRFRAIRGHARPIERELARLSWRATDEPTR